MVAVLALVLFSSQLAVAQGDWDVTVNVKKKNILTKIIDQLGGYFLSVSAYKEEYSPGETASGMLYGHIDAVSSGVKSEPVAVCDSDSVKAGVYVEDSEGNTVGSDTVETRECISVGALDWEVEIPNNAELGEYSVDGYYTPVGAVWTRDFGSTSFVVAKGCTVESPCDEFEFGVPGDYCYNGDVAKCYDTDSDDCLDASIEGCGEDSCTSGSDICRYGDVYKEKTCYERGCDEGFCFERQSSSDYELVERCGTNEKCSAGECVTTTVDSDNDGVIDSNDACPNQGNLGNGLKDNGCPYKDSDKDGVMDSNDGCPNKPGPASNQGCPISQPKPQKPVWQGIIDSIINWFKNIGLWK